MKASNDSALRRAELRKIRPTRGPFRIGGLCFSFYDQADTVAGPNHWRGVARVVGREGSRIVLALASGFTGCCIPGTFVPCK